MVEAGLTALEAMQTATINPAEFEIANAIESDGDRVFMPAIAESLAFARIFSGSDGGNCQLRHQSISDRNSRRVIKIGKFERGDCLSQTD